MTNFVNSKVKNVKFQSKCNMGTAYSVKKLFTIRKSVEFWVRNDIFGMEVSKHFDISLSSIRVRNVEVVLFISILTLTLTSRYENGLILKSKYSMYEHDNMSSMTFACSI
jgi:hypothetical protein